MSEFIKKEEIDLIELLGTIWKNKFKIFSFSFVVLLLTFLYVLSIPNSYKSLIVLAPQGEENNLSGGLSSLASLAGVNLGGGSSKDPSIMMEITLKDYSFNKYVIKKYNLVEKLENQKNLVFALGFDKIYNLFNFKTEDNRDIEKMLYDTINFLNKKTLSISKDKESGLIILSATLNDRFLAKELVDIYLVEVINKIKMQDMKEIDEQIRYYNKELSSTYDVSLKEQLSKSLSALYQKRVFSQANDYYFVSKVIDSRVSHIKEKVKPKRALTLIVSFVTSIIIGIFLVFFVEFIKGSKGNEET